MTPMDGGGRETIDSRIETPGREGLTGTAGANAYTPAVEVDQVTIAPDWRPLDEQPAWRQDFPIDAPQDQYVARRDFMKFMVLISFAFTSGQLWIAAQNWLRRQRGQPGIRKIATLTEIPVGGVRMFAYPDEHNPCVLIRPTPEVVVAYSQQCTHLSCAVLPQPERHRLYCPCHEGAFDLLSGRPTAGPPRRPLPRILLDVRGDEIYATGIELRTT